MNGENELADRVKAAFIDGTPLSIRGGGTKGFLGRRCEGVPFDVSGHSGIVDYDPKELVITAKCGTTLEEIERVLFESNQMLPFEPPKYGISATLGGTIACGLSGPRRPYAGSVRDHLLGCRIVNGKGDVLNFGGRVMKNVAGFDVSRLMAGAFGTLGLVLEASLKVLPKPAASLTLCRECGADDAISAMNDFSAKPFPVDGAAYVEGACHVRLSGSLQAVSEARTGTGWDLLDDADAFWEALKEQHLPFFDTGRLWRIASRPSSRLPELKGEWLIEWGGAQRWLKTDCGEDDIRHAAQSMGGHATLYRGEGDSFHPLQPALLALHKRLKTAFDPEGIFNPGRLYPEF